MRQNKPKPCRGCGQLIVFQEQSNGRMHPCEPEKVTAGELQIGDNMLTAEGERIVISETTPPELNGWLSHFPNCSEADSFRTKR